MILLIDNYDSFTYNLYQYIGELYQDIQVVRNDEISLDEIEKLSPQALIISPGPGYPKDAGISVEAIKHFSGKLPILGICLGHQLMALAHGATTQKLKYGHRGANQPVIDKALGKTFVTSQNHGYAVVGESMDPEIGEVSHINANDGTCEGMRYKNINAFTVQFHPEAHGGPQDTAYLFDEFIEMIKKEMH